jgi:hypothetical protein
VHEAKTGQQTTKLLAIYVVEKGKPLASRCNHNQTETIRDFAFLALRSCH